MSFETTKQKQKQNKNKSKTKAKQNKKQRMDLKQRKLTKAEWEAIEVPVSGEELEVLKLIVNGFSDLQLKINHTETMLTCLKMEQTPQLDEFLFNKFFTTRVKTLVDTYNVAFVVFDDKKKSMVAASLSDDNICNINVGSIVKLKSSDQIRMARMSSFGNNGNNNNLFEFTLITMLEDMMRLKSSHDRQWMCTCHTLSNLLKTNIAKVNSIVHILMRAFVLNLEHEVNLMHLVSCASSLLEKNECLRKHADLTLYAHQKTIFSHFRASCGPSLVLYNAPTGMGKTLTPLGISERFKVIFVCAARHVGIALARSAISVDKRIAFAFGCSAAEDVRLHYFAAKECIRDKRTGNIKKVDNTVGDDVEIIICDVRSYLPAMYYMASFNPVETIVTYWDEPTITMDYEHHELHKVIKKNWRDNIVPNIVLSSATLPRDHELTEMIADFHHKFENGSVVRLESYDCCKTIPLIDNNGFVSMPHTMPCCELYENVLKTAQHCRDNLTLMRYFDVHEVARFIQYVETHKYQTPTARFERHLCSMDDISINSVKMYYLRLLENIVPEHWTTIYTYFQQTKEPRIPTNHTVDAQGNKLLCRMTSVGATSAAATAAAAATGAAAPTQGQCGVYVTTKDAYTLTDGPTIFMANDLNKIARFCINQANIPSAVLYTILSKIECNNQLTERIKNIERQLAFEEEKMSEKLNGTTADSSKEASQLSRNKKEQKKKEKIANKLVGKVENNAKIREMHENMVHLQAGMKSPTIDDIFVPNKQSHVAKWAAGLNTTRSFTSRLDESVVVRIMMLDDVDNSWKILLMLGIGVFAEHKSSAYTEIMKSLADEQRLYMIIADSDYIFGTNYQFCHGYISKDLCLTQAKIIQALGRIGRNNLQQDYTARFRDNAHIETLFTHLEPHQQQEVLNMNKLLNSKNVKWNAETLSFEEDEDEEDEDEDEKEDEKEDDTQDKEEDDKEKKKSNKFNDDDYGNDDEADDDNGDADEDD